MKLNSKIKEQTGSITLFVLVSIFFFVTILITIYAKTNIKKEQQQKEINQIQESYENENVNELYNKAKEKKETE